MSDLLLLMFIFLLVLGGLLCFVVFYFLDEIQQLRDRVKKLEERK